MLPLLANFLTHIAPLIDESLHHCFCDTLSSAGVIIPSQCKREVSGATAERSVLLQDEGDKSPLFG